MIIERFVVPRRQRSNRLDQKDVGRKKEPTGHNATYLSDIVHNYLADKENQRLLNVGRHDQMEIANVCAFPFFSPVVRFFSEFLHW